MARKPPLAISMGEPAGVGPDLILQLFAQRKSLRLPPFLVYGNLEFLRARARRLGLEIAMAEAEPATANAVFVHSLPVIDLGQTIADQPGKPDPMTAEIVLEAISKATGDCLTRSCRALVTAPIHKATLKKTGFAHPGHTEFLASLCAGGGEAPTPIMMLVHESFRVVPLTIHIALAEVAQNISTQMVVRKARIMARGLRTCFGIAKPKIAVTGLNPHAGEEGNMGSEDREEITPAVALLRKEGLDVTGPLPADTLFHPEHWQHYDVVLAMYHDQALIPIKTLAFDQAVNVTLGLPILRTSPDHGTAFDLAGTGRASANSFLAAIRLAGQMSTSVQ